MKRTICKGIAAILSVLVMAGCQQRQESIVTVVDAGVEEVQAKKTQSPTIAERLNMPRPCPGPVGTRVAGKRVLPDAPACITAADVSLMIDSGSVNRAVDISVVAVAEGGSGPIPAEMENVTAGGAVYRMLPDGQKFEKDITVAMKYDSTALPYGYTADDIYTFFYNEEAGLWQRVERDSVDTLNQVVYSRTDHFTDYINGVLKVPENNDATAYTPTSIKDLKAADPLEGITLIAPPEANNTGTASLTYPLSIPAGRRGMQPQLSVSYSSAGGSGILGLGWSLPVSEISVETRWGVPLYSPALETECYLLDGETLVTAYIDDHGNFRLNKPVYHRRYQARSTNDTTRFYPRREGSFRRIQRVGTGPTDYHWVVTDKDGTRHYYGQHGHARLCGPTGNIAKWMLEKSEDLYGNCVYYNYVTLYGEVEGAAAAHQVALSRVYYTANDNESAKGAYTLRFHYAEKEDPSVSFRNGVEECDRYLLDKIQVLCKDTLTKEYYFGYKRDVFGKTLLCNVVESYEDCAKYQDYWLDGHVTNILRHNPYDRCGISRIDGLVCIHLAHEFEYYEPDMSAPFSGPVEMGYGDMEDPQICQNQIGSLHERDNFTANKTKGWSVSGGLNLGTDYFGWEKSMSVGGHYSYNSSEAEGLAMLADIDGDGYPDKLFTTFQGGLMCRRQIPGENRFGPVEMLTGGPVRFQHSQNRTHSWGVEASVGLGGGGANWSDERSSTDSYLADINGDGLVDIVSEGRVYANRGNLVFSDVTGNDTLMVAGGCGDDTLAFDGEVDTTLFSDGDCVVEYMVCDTVKYKVTICDTVYYSPDAYNLEYHTETRYKLVNCHMVSETTYYEYPRRYEPDVDLVRMWKAPYGGTVAVSGKARLTPDLAGLRAAARANDGVQIFVQRLGTASTEYDESLLPGDSLDVSCQITVDEGDTLLFRISSGEKRLYDRVEWNPTVDYVSVIHRGTNQARSLDSRDANGKGIYHFDYSGDYMVGGCQSVSFLTTNPAFHNYHVSCSLQVAKPLSQAIRYSIVSMKIDGTGVSTVEGQTVLSAGSMPNTVLTDVLTNIDSDRKLVLRLEADGGGEVDWSSITTYATVRLTSTSDQTLSSMMQSAGNHFCTCHPVVERCYHDYLAFPSQVLTDVSSYASVQVDVTPSTFSGDLYMTVKGLYDNSCIGETVTVAGGTCTLSVTPRVLNDTQQYSVDFYTYDTLAASQIQGITVHLGNSPAIQAGLYGKYCDDIYKHHGTLYRGWGQFGYKPDNPGAALVNRDLMSPGNSFYSRIPESGFITTNSDVHINNPALGPDCSPETPVGGIYRNPVSYNFFEMSPDTCQRWAAYGNTVTASRTVMSLDNNDPSEAFGETVTVDRTQSPLPEVHPGRPLKAVYKNSMSRSFGYTVAFASKTMGSTRQLSDFTDLNGDGYPDAVSEKAVQYSRAQGGLSTLSIPYGPVEGISSSNNTVTGQSFNGTFQLMTRELSNSPRSSRMVSMLSGLAQIFNITPTNGNDEVSNTLMDFNGDGLPDIVSSSGKVRYNMGYGFTVPRDMPHFFLRKSSSSSFDIGLSPGFNNGNTSICGGVSYTASENRTNKYLTDLNGDGLPDRVSDTYAYINLGDGTFGTAITLPGVDVDTTKTYGANVGATYDATFSIFGFPVKLGISLGGGTSATRSATRGEWTDMDNDGCPDYVERTDDGKILVHYSNLRKSGLLKSVTNFAGAQYQIDYTLESSTEQSAHRNWTMTTLRMSDGCTGDGPDTVYRRFCYGNRKYNRYEKTDYGYDTVLTSEYRTRAGFLADSAFRTQIRIHHNNSYLLHGLVAVDSSADSTGSRWAVTHYSYLDADLLTGVFPDTSEPDWCHGDGWPALSTERIVLKDGDYDDDTLVSMKRFQYGPFGNVTRHDDYGDLDDFGATTGNDYTVYLDYDIDTVKYTVAKVSDILISGYLHRSAKYNIQGDIDQLTVDNGPNADPSVYAFKYDGFGNPTIVTTPATDPTNNSSYKIFYTYDPVTHSLPVTITNTEGHTSHAAYSYCWQKPLVTMDIGGSVMEYTYDRHGRTLTVTAPAEAADNQPYTVRYEYWYRAKLIRNALINPNVFPGQEHLGRPHMCWTRTYNHDPGHTGNDIVTMAFSDALGRVVQVKHDMDVAGVERRVAEGSVQVDALGRKVREYLSVDEALNVPDSNLNICILSVPFARTEYDWQDRPLRTVAADNSRTSYAYSIDYDQSNTKRLVCDITDANGNTSRIYTDMRGQRVQITDADDNITVMQYDPVGQLVQTVDPENNYVSHEYDLGGRRIRRVHPSAGTTQWTYDAAGHTVRQTQNSGSTVDYHYLYNRLVHVEHSDNGHNDVWYEYGAAGTGNGAGRVTRMQDASGVKAFSYDALGNVTSEKHTCLQPQSTNTFTLTTLREYDSWGRLRSVVYPDAETVTYSYDHGGLLTSITGSKYGQPASIYLDNVKYNRNGQRIYEEYGNRVVTTYAYDTLNQRLKRLKDTIPATGQKLQDIIYTYDSVGNILAIGDSGLHPRVQTFEYDNLYRLEYSTGSWTHGTPEYNSSYSYSPAGRMLTKVVNSVRKDNSGGDYIWNYSNTYQYPVSGNPFAPSAVQFSPSSSMTMTWDNDGNLHTTVGPGQDDARTLCWTEENRLQGFLDCTVDGSLMACYVYDADGERCLKLTSPRMSVQQNGATLPTLPLNSPTFYPSPLITLTKKGYTKHYFEENRRICSKIGGGFGNVVWDSMTAQVPPIKKDYNTNSYLLLKGLRDVTGFCLGVIPQFNTLPDVQGMLYEHERLRNVSENAFYYHSDHLGSAAYLTNDHAQVSQTLNYLPYGEDWVDIHNNLDFRLGQYTFNGKEKDSESGFHYYGARYYWSEVLTGWLSVDPMADKYPGVSPYAYCVWNPVKLVDPDGRDTIKINLNEGSFEHTKADGNHCVQYHKDGELIYSNEIKKENCYFITKSVDLIYTENNERKYCRTNHLLCSNSETGEAIFRKIAEIGSPVEWDYYSIKMYLDDVSSGDLSSSGINNKMVQPQGQYTRYNVNYWDHYHPNNNSECFFPSYSDQDHARELGGVRCTIFNNGLSMDFQNYVPPIKGTYISESKFRDIWNHFAR